MPNKSETETADYTRKNKIIWTWNTKSEPCVLNTLISQTNRKVISYQGIDLHIMHKHFLEVSDGGFIVCKN